MEEALLVQLAGLGALGEDAQAVDEQVVEVHRVQLALALHVLAHAGEQLLGGGGEVAGAGLEVFGGVEVAVDGAGKEGEDELALGEVLGPVTEVLDDAAHEGALVVGVEDGEVAGEAEQAGVAAQHAVGDVVERAAPEAGGEAARGLVGAREHLAGGAVGEGEQEDAVRRDAALDEVDDAVDERAGLARPGGGEDEQGAVGGGGGLELLGVQEGAQVGHGRGAIAGRRWRGGG